MTRPNWLLILISIGVVFLTTATIEAADWPQWQGPNRDGKSADTGLLKRWPENGPPLAWRIDKLGGGDSGPAIAAGRVFVMSNRGDEEVVCALSEKDGSEIWVMPLGPAFQQRASQGKEGPGCTPTVDGERLYVEGLGGNVACLQVQDGKIIWQRSLTEDFGGRVPMWCYRESPLKSDSIRRSSRRASRAGGMTGASQKMLKTLSPPEAEAHPGASSCRRAAGRIRSPERSPMRPPSNSLNWRLRKSDP